MGQGKKEDGDSEPLLFSEQYAVGEVCEGPGDPVAGVGMLQL